jgi:hypothetical protein
LCRESHGFERHADGLRDLVVFDETVAGVDAARHLPQHRIVARGPDITRCSVTELIFAAPA